MIKRDFHGWTLDEALQEIHHIVGNVRKQSKVEQAQFITGNGEIKKQIIYLLKRYDLAPDNQWGNDGVVIVTIE